MPEDDLFTLGEASMTEWTRPGHYDREHDQKLRQEIAENWHEEAADAALEGNPPKAHYLEWMAGRVLDPNFGSGVKS